MQIQLLNTDFNPWQILQEYQPTANAGQFGATAIFVGTMRDFNEGSEVESLYLEHYPGMTEKQLTEIAQTAITQWQLLDVLLVHRVGEVVPNQAIVLVAVWATHRGAAFDACRYLMETLKAKATFWKQEVLIDKSTRWVTKNTDGYCSKV